jgi:hypothetical protein
MHPNHSHSLDRLIPTYLYLFILFIPFILFILVLLITARYLDIESYVSPRNPIHYSNSHFRIQLKVVQSSHHRSLHTTYFGSTLTTPLHFHRFCSTDTMQPHSKLVMAQQINTYTSPYEHPIKLCTLCTHQTTSIRIQNANPLPFKRIFARCAA